mgnify:CR=1 FL=1
MANLNNGSAIPASNSAVNSTVNNTNTNSLGGNSMTNINATTARQKFFKVLNSCVKHNEVVNR